MTLTSELFLLNEPLVGPSGFSSRKWFHHQREGLRGESLPLSGISGMGMWGQRPDGAGPGHCAVSHHRATTLAAGIAVNLR